MIYYSNMYGLLKILYYKRQCDKASILKKVKSPELIKTEEIDSETNNKFCRELHCRV